MIRLATKSGGKGLYMGEETGFLEIGGVKIAFDKLDGKGPTVIFCGGYASARKSTKASALLEWARTTGKNYIRFDYSGHGDSSGRFEDATLGQWLDETTAVIDRVADPAEKVVLVGSSMGGWISLLAAQKRPDRLKGLVTIACGADFTQVVLSGILTPPLLAMLEEKGVLYRPNPEGVAPTPLTWKFLQESKRHLLLGGTISVTCPVRMFHGLRDMEAPWSISRSVLEKLSSSDATLELIKEGGHRLSSPADMVRLIAAIEGLSQS